MDTLKRKLIRQTRAVRYYAKLHHLAMEKAWLKWCQSGLAEQYGNWYEENY